MLTNYHLALGLYELFWFLVFSLPLHVTAKFWTRWEHRAKLWVWRTDVINQRSSLLPKDKCVSTQRTLWGADWPLPSPCLRTDGWRDCVDKGERQRGGIRRRSRHTFSREAGNCSQKLIKELEKHPAVQQHQDAHIFLCDEWVVCQGDVSFKHCSLVN